MCVEKKGNPKGKIFTIGLDIILIVLLSVNISLSLRNDNINTTKVEIESSTMINVDSLFNATVEIDSVTVESDSLN